jgi:hypothetical protein
MQKYYSKRIAKIVILTNFILIILYKFDLKQNRYYLFSLYKQLIENSEIKDFFGIPVLPMFFES